jgi:hypothetical protein
VPHEEKEEKATASCEADTADQQLTQVASVYTVQRLMHFFIKTNKTLVLYFSSPDLFLAHTAQTRLLVVLSVQSRTTPSPPCPGPISV